MDLALADMVVGLPSSDLGTEVARALASGMSMAFSCL